MPILKTAKRRHALENIWINFRFALNGKCLNRSILILLQNPTAKHTWIASCIGGTGSISCDLHTHHNAHNTQNTKVYLTLWTSCDALHHQAVNKKSFTMGYLLIKDATHSHSLLSVDFYHSSEELLGPWGDVWGDVETTSLHLFQQDSQVIIIKWKGPLQTSWHYLMWFTQWKCFTTKRA